MHLSIYFHNMISFVAFMIYQYSFYDNIIALPRIKASYDMVICGTYRICDKFRIEFCMHFECYFAYFRAVIKDPNSV